MRLPFETILLRAILCLVIMLTPAFSQDALTRLSAAQLVERLAAPAMPGGFIAQLGWGDGQPALQLATAGKYAIHVLEPDAAKVATARALLRERNLHGIIAVEWWPERFLPYGEDLINALLVADSLPVAAEEITRVTAPLGTIWLKQGAVWAGRTKPWPKEYDQWTHWRHEADGNMVSRDKAIKTPTGVRWVAGPAQDTGGRKWYYDHVLISANGRNLYLYEDGIVARDAFNGRLLWTRDMKAYSFQESGSPIFLKLGVRPSKVRPVAQGDRIYTALDGQLVALDATDGRTVQTFGELRGPREILATSGRVVMSDTNGIRAYTTGGEPSWSVSEMPKRMVAGNGRVHYTAGNEVVALDAETGRPLWRVGHDKAGEAVTCTLAGGVLILERSSWKDDAPGNGLLVFSAASGALLWEKDYTPGMTHWKEARAFFMDNLLWIQTTKQRIIGMDPITGKEQKQFVSRGLHCAAPLATENFFIAPEVEFTDLKTGERDRARMVKSACRLPFVPANGLLYTFPVQCECFPMLRGYMGLAQTPPSAKSIAPRLQKGPAYDTKSTGEITDQDWPMYRRDRFRSGYLPQPLPTGKPKILWQAAIATNAPGTVAADWEDNPFTCGLVTPPVCAAGVALAVAPDRHEIVALDSADGAVKWRFVAGGRVDSPPSIWNSRCVFGSHDGFVYCLNLSDGALAWRFRAAPQDNRIAAYGQLESVWPVAGGVLIENGRAYFAAGRHPASDGGVRVCAVQVADGKLLWEKTVTDSGVSDWYSGMLPGTKVKVGVDYEPVDLMVRDGNQVAMSRWQFAPETGKMTLAFTNTNYVAFASLKVPRGAWGYGIRQTKLVYPKPAITFNETTIHRGNTNEVAVLLAGATLVAARDNGELAWANHSLKLDAPLVRDGLAAARGRIYASARNGRIYCIGFE